MTVESTDFELETHNRQVSETVASARRALKTAEEQDSLPDWLKALETTLKVCAACDSVVSVTRFFVSNTE